MKKIIANGTIVLASSQQQQDILIEDGIVQAIGHDLGDADEVIDASGKLIFSGFIDCHVHFREPGFPEKGTMKSESIAARAGGVTTVCEMPNTSPPTFTIEALRQKAEIADGIEECDVRFFFGATTHEHLEQLKTLWTSDDPAKKRCTGLKLFLENSTGNLKIEDGVAEAAFALCSEIGCPIVAHCEDPTINDAAAKIIRESDNFSDDDASFHTLMRPAQSEQKSIRDAIELVKKYGTQFHIAHLSTELGLDVVRQAKADGLPVTCEVTPHHLFLSTEDYEHLGTLAKMNPPLRTFENCEALWEGVVDGTVDCIATDHAPHTRTEKNIKPALDAPSGVPGVETMIPLLLSAAGGVYPHSGPRVSEGSRRLDYEDIVRLCFDNPNRIYRLGKQGIQVGSSDSIVIVDPTAEWEMCGKDLHYHCGWTPYEGWAVRGKVQNVV